MRLAGPRLPSRNGSVLLRLALLGASVALPACKCSKGEADAGAPSATAAVAAAAARATPPRPRPARTAAPKPTATASAEAPEPSTSASAAPVPYTIADDCRDPSVLLAITDDKPIADRSFPDVRTVLQRLPGFVLTDELPLKTGQVKLFVYDYGKEHWALVASCFDGRTCNRLAAGFRAADAGADLAIVCGPIPNTGDATTAHP